MGSRIFIFALPRSRTAWAANLLSWATSHCYHELWAQCRTPDEFADELDKWPADYTVGNSDSTNLVFADWIFDHYPGAKFVYLERSEEAVIAAMERCQPNLSFTIPHLREVARFAREGVLQRGGLVLNVDTWSPSDTILLWSYCLPHIPFPKQRNEQLEWMRVTITDDRWEDLKQKAEELYA